MNKISCSLFVFVLFVCVCFILLFIISFSMAAFLFVLCNLKISWRFHNKTTFLEWSKAYHPPHEYLKTCYRETDKRHSIKFLQNSATV